MEEILTTEPEKTLKLIKEKLENSNNLIIFLTSVNNVMEKLLITMKKPNIESEKGNEKHYIEPRKAHAI